LGFTGFYRLKDWRTLKRKFRTLFLVCLGAAAAIAVAAPGIPVALLMRLQGDQWQFEGGGLREWLFGQMTLIGQSGQIAPYGAPARYYIRFQEGTAAQAASMEYTSRRPPTDAIDFFRAFCLSKGLTVSGAQEEKVEAGELNIMCLPPGKAYRGKFESSYLFLSATPSGMGCHVSVVEMAMN
jgi:hypothetical protein